MKRTIALVGSEVDPQLRAVAGHLTRLGADHTCVDFSSVERGERLTIQGARAQLGSLRLDRVAAAYIRQVPGPWPPLVENEDGEAVVLQQWMAPFMLAREREQAVMGVLLDWHARGVAMLNAPVHGALSQNKPNQLLLAQQLDVPVPATCITNDVDDAIAFIRRHRRVIAKPVHGGALTQAITDEDLDRRGFKARLARIAAAPVIFQERVDGDDIRLMLLGRRVLACHAIRLPEGAVLDFRGSDTYQGGQARYEPVALPPAVREAAVRWARACGLTLAGVDIKRTSRGRHVLLECNSSPIYLDQEWKTGAPVSEGIARWLWRRLRRAG